MTLEELQKKYQNVLGEYKEYDKAINWSNIQDDLYKDLIDMGYIGCVYTDFLIYDITSHHPATLLIHIYKHNCNYFV